jgi:hypothetical protein
MRFLLSALLLLPASSHAVTPVQCSQMADVLYALINGQQPRFPAEFQPFLMKAAEDYNKNPGRDPYYYSTRLFMECLRTNGDLARMYDPRHLVDPEKQVRQG